MLHSPLCVRYERTFWASKYFHTSLACSSASNHILRNSRYLRQYGSVAANRNGGQDFPVTQHIVLRRPLAFTRQQCGLHRDLNATRSAQPNKIGAPPSPKSFEGGRSPSRTPGMQYRMTSRNQEIWNKADCK